MTSLLELRDKESITTAEAINFCLPLVGKYQSVLINVIRIKSSTPETNGEGFGRKTTDNMPLLLELEQILVALDIELQAILHELEQYEN
jgi:hypothetical protein